MGKFYVKTGRLFIHRLIPEELKSEIIETFENSNIRNEKVIYFKGPLSVYSRPNSKFKLLVNDFPVAHTVQDNRFIPGENPLS